MSRAEPRLRRLLSGNHGTLRGWVRHTLAQIEYLLGRLDRFVALSPRNVERLVFVCLGNINRSAFAAAVARQRGLAVASIGLSTTTGAPATPMAQRCAAELGIDLTAHSATDIGDYQRQPGDLLLVMETRHARALAARGFEPASIVLLGFWASPLRLHLHDPHTLSERYFRSCFTLIHSAVNHLAIELRSAASPCARG